MLLGSNRRNLCDGWIFCKFRQVFCNELSTDFQVPAYRRQPLSLDTLNSVSSNAYIGTGLATKPSKRPRRCVSQIRFICCIVRGLKEKRDPLQREIAAKTIEVHRQVSRDIFTGVGERNPYEKILFFKFFSSSRNFTQLSCVKIKNIKTNPNWRKIKLISQKYRN